MQAVRMYDWAAESVEKVTKQHREAQACQRRLKQMQAKREKDAKRAARKAAENGTPGGWFRKWKQTIEDA